VDLSAMKRCRGTKRHPKRRIIIANCKQPRRNADVLYWWWLQEKKAKRTHKMPRRIGQLLTNLKRHTAFYASIWLFLLLVMLTFTFFQKVPPKVAFSQSIYWIFIKINARFFFTFPSKISNFYVNCLGAI
jgi:hypothetical protein